MWKSIWGPDLFGTKKVEKWPQDHYFSQKVLLVGTPSYIYTERELCNGSAGTFFQMINVGDDIDLNVFMSHFNDLCY